MLLSVPLIRVGLLIVNLERHQIRCLKEFLALIVAPNLPHLVVYFNPVVAFVLLLIFLGTLSQSLH